jgi:hypothetical protein
MNQLSDADHKEVLYDYTRFMFTSFTQGYIDYDRASILFKNLFDNYMEKIVNVGGKRFDQSVSCVICASDAKIMTMCLTINRDYYKVGKNELIDNYLYDEHFFECVYFNQFNEWYARIRELTNNFDHNAFDQYVNANIIGQIEQDFTMPFHENEMLMEYMMKKFAIRSIPYMCVESMDTGNTLNQITYETMGPNFFVMNKDCRFVKIRKMNIG